MITLMASFCLSEIARTAASLVVPEVTTTVLPSRSRYELMRDERGTSSLVPAIKKIGEKETSLMRWKLAVVEPHSRSISAESTAEILVSAVTFLYSTAISTDRKSTRLNSTTAPQRSIE